MKTVLVLVGIAGIVVTAFGQRPERVCQLKTRVLQPPYAADAKGEPASTRWLLDELDRCDESLDLIVLPEFSDVPARIGGSEFHAAVSNNNARLLKSCAETARRCKAMLFVNALYETSAGWRNTTHAFDRAGRCVGRYFKRHVTAGEHVKLGFDVSYTREWSEPHLLEIEGIRFAFMTCYDFYFYEGYASVARYQPDVIIGCSLQRSDPLHVLRFINEFCAYNIGAYLVRSSVSLAPDSQVGGSSMVVAPDGHILENLEGRPGTLTVTFDPFKKYLKPAGFGNPPATHPSYVEIGRRPWLYRPGGSAIVPPFAEASPKRLCACRGLASVENPLASLGAAVALGASEIAFDLWRTKDGERVALQGQAPGESALRLCDVLRKLSCHAIMNIRLKVADGSAWSRTDVQRVLGTVDAFDARKHVYFTTADETLLGLLAEIAADIPRCLEQGARRPDRTIESACRNRCALVQFDGPVDMSMVGRAQAAGLRCNLCASGGPEALRQCLSAGADTVLVGDYQSAAGQTGLK